jgi:hypothetical protein
VEGSCEHDNEPSGSIKCSEDLESVHNLRLLKKGSAPSVGESYKYIVSKSRSAMDDMRLNIAYYYLLHFCQISMFLFFLIFCGESSV